MDGVRSYDTLGAFCTAHQGQGGRTLDKCILLLRTLFHAMPYNPVSNLLYGCYDERKQSYSEGRHSDYLEATMEQIPTTLHTHILFSTICWASVFVARVIICSMPSILSRRGKVSISELVSQTFVVCITNRPGRRQIFTSPTFSIFIPRSLCFLFLIILRR